MAKTKKQTIPGVINRVWVKHTSYFHPEDGGDVLEVKYEVQYSKLDKKQQEVYDKAAANSLKDGKEDLTHFTKHIHGVRLLDVDGVLIPYSKALVKEMLLHNEYFFEMQSKFYELQTTKNWKTKLAKNS